jgi:hypothetical protein
MTRTITLTAAAPVKIREDEWPVIAVGVFADHDGKIKAQANCTWEMSIRVRRHEDGRAIIYAEYEYDTLWQNEDCLRAKSGEVCDAGADIVAAIRRVGATIAEAAAEAGHDDFGAHVSAAIRECVANLPAVEM